MTTEHMEELYSFSLGYNESNTRIRQETRGYTKSLRDKVNKLKASLEYTASDNSLWSAWETQGTTLQKLRATEIDSVTASMHKGKLEITPDSRLRRVFVLSGSVSSNYSLEPYVEGSVFEILFGDTVTLEGTCTLQIVWR